MYFVPSGLPDIMPKQTPSWDFVFSTTLPSLPDMLNPCTGSNGLLLSIGMSITATVHNRFFMKIDRYFLSVFINFHFIPARGTVQNKAPGKAKDTHSTFRWLRESAKKNI